MFRATWNWTHRFAKDDHCPEDMLKTDHPRSAGHVDAIRALLAHDSYLLHNEDCFHLKYSPEYSQSYFAWKDLIPESQFQVDSSFFGPRSKTGKSSILNGAYGIPRVNIGT
jgi:hypothetical protein